MSKNNILILLLILGTAFWGVSFPVTKMAIGYSSPFIFLFYRFLAATFFLSLVFSKKLKQINWATARIGGELAIPLMLGIYLQTMGIKYTSASQTAFLAGMSVILIPLLKIAMYRHLAPAKIWVACFFALTGLAIISIKNDFSVNTGDLYTVAGAFAFAYYLIRVEKYSRNVDIVTTIVPMFGTCTLLTFIMALMGSSNAWLPDNNSFWIAVGFCALFSTAYMYSVSNIAQRYLSAERVSIIYLFEPVFGAIAAAYLLNEELSWRLLLGGCLIFIGMLVSELNFKKVGVLSKLYQ
ncbi:DMT family transporter [Pedobacter sp. B4-66]|uniref:DMT family transporter n=1 Tax=Pedobacter sp. B4-66 TaxID=2817280 RepID=UPI001BD937DC|nr:DMT family transporter [Pedobacter sp. B4-66]